MPVSPAKITNRRGAMSDPELAFQRPAAALLARLWNQPGEPMTDWPDTNRGPLDDLTAELEDRHGPASGRAMTAAEAYGLKPGDRVELHTDDGDVRPLVVTETHGDGSFTAANPEAVAATERLLRLERDLNRAAQQYADLNGFPPDTAATSAGEQPWPIKADPDEAAYYRKLEDDLEQLEAENPEVAAASAAYDEMARTLPAKIRGEDPQHRAARQLTDEERAVIAHLREQNRRHEAKAGRLDLGGAA